MPSDFSPTVPASTGVLRRVISLSSALPWGELLICAFLILAIKVA